MTKEARITVRIASAGLGAIEKLMDETKTDKSKVVCELLAVAVTTPSVRDQAVKRLKQRKGIE